jgi:hypothetical protein
MMKIIIIYKYFLFFNRENSKMLKEFEDYKTKCMKKLPKQLAGFFIFSLKNSVKRFCKKDSQQLTNMIESSPCINRANTQISKCYSNLIDKILGAQNANDTRKIPHLCCEMHKFYPCIATQTKKISICTESHIKTLSDLVREQLGKQTNVSITFF